MADGLPHCDSVLFLERKISKTNHVRIYRQAERTKVLHLQVIFLLQTIHFL